MSLFHFFAIYAGIWTEYVEINFNYIFTDKMETYEFYISMINFY